MRIKQLKTYLLDNREHVDFMKEIKDFIVSNETKFLNINETFNRFASLVRKEIRIVNNNTSESLFAKELELSDQRRDGYYMSIRLITRAYLVHPDSELKFAAQRIDKLLNKFGDIRHLAYDQETVLITKFCSEIASLKEETDKLNLGEWIDFLEKENIAFRYYQDDIEREQAITGDGKQIKSVRNQTDEVYNDLVFRIEAVSLINSSEKYLNYIRNINDIISKAQTFIDAKEKQKDTDKNLFDNPTIYPESYY